MEYVLLMTPYVDKSINLVFVMFTFEVTYGAVKILIGNVFTYFILWQGWKCIPIFFLSLHLAMYNLYVRSWKHPLITKYSSWYLYWLNSSLVVSSRLFWHAVWSSIDKSAQHWPFSLGSPWNRHDISQSQWKPYAGEELISFHYIHSHFYF